MNSQEADIVEKIGGFGWMVMQASPLLSADEPQEWFAYTIGLPQRFGWPEFLVFNLDQKLMHNLLDNAVQECLRRGVSPAPGLLLNDVVGGAKAKLGSIDASDWSSRLAWSHWYLDHIKFAQRFNCLQLLWPDRNGRFPGDAGCDPAVRADQTPLRA